MVCCIGICCANFYKIKMLINRKCNKLLYTHIYKKNRSNFENNQAMSLLSKVPVAEN